ncbi:energy transducer TonB [Pseudomonas sp. UBA2684]|uniref:energy transducer TonB n=1 Tax=Pseudomonas sp. UBA2684 TaxID=1947311 RepID=UPI0025E1374F|nr:energy transducer TonB [Pseudomonas sp. UBA2684]|tara:strand:+ start:4057 stop:4704 length:648 start_codon:yes stop_codon:yes gene_type:complete
MPRFPVFLLLSLAVHIAASRLLPASAAAPDVAPPSAAASVLHMPQVQLQRPSLAPATLAPQPQPQPQRISKPLVKADKPRETAKASAPAASPPALAAAVATAAPVRAASAVAPEALPPPEVFSREPSFREHPKPPHYPSQARRRNQQGTVLVEVRLDARGELRSLNVLRSSGIDSLDRAALDAVAAWRFRPETLGGRGVPSRVQIPIQFALSASR